LIWSACLLLLVLIFQVLDLWRYQDTICFLFLHVAYSICRLFAQAHWPS
jgi:hypothetical protein